MKQDKTLEIAEVTQFFDFKGMMWSELVQTKNKGVLPDTTGTKFLWCETPKLKIVKLNEDPQVGSVWLKKSKTGGIEVHKANYDTSD